MTTTTTTPTPADTAVASPKDALARQVAVLGCGPAGLLVAHAVRQAGFLPIIFSLKNKSPIGGAQFLHSHVPQITDPSPEAAVHINKWGEPEVYAKKVYGDPHAPTSWFEYDEGSYPIWNLRAAYDGLWGRYQARIINTQVTSDIIPGLLEQYRAVFSTIPKVALCFNGHQFVKQPVHISYGADPDIQDNTIVYNGNPEQDWYRQSMLFGTKGTEWAHKPNGVETVEVAKPLHNDCDCWPQVKKFGRYGEWRKGLLVHHAYQDARKAMEELRWQ